MTQANAEVIEKTRMQGWGALVEQFGLFVGTDALPFDDLEQAVLRVANELARQYLERELNRMARTFGTEVEVSGARYRCHATGAKRYHTLVGPVNVRRASYRLVGVRNGPTVVPLELEAGIVENATPALAFSVLQGFAERPLRHYEDEMKAAHRCVPSRSTLERIGKRVGEEIRYAQPALERIARETEALPEAAYSVSVGLDRTTVPMAEHVETPRRSRRAPYVRRAPSPVTVNYRMAYVGTVAVHDADGETLVSWRFAASANEGPADMLERMGDEVLHVLSQRPAMPLTVVQDGAPELWNLIEEWLARHDLTAAATLIDRFHVNERLAQTCELIAQDGHAAAELFENWQRCLDRSDTAMHRICRRLDELSDHMVGSALEGELAPPYWEHRARTRLSGESARIVWGNHQYFHRYRSKMQYARSRRMGLPIGSGVTEGACKSVVTMRFKRSGQRWRESGLTPCLQLRALHLNRRLRSCFDLLVHGRHQQLAGS